MALNFEFLISSLTWISRILLAALCGCIIGYERTSRNKGAGIRTHAILALGSALMMLVSKYGFFDILDFDASRVAAQIVSGVGFLGAGVIFVKNGNISGLTTAAGMWATSGVGMCIGAGLYSMGIFSSAVLIGLQTIFHRGFFIKLEQNTQNIYMEIYNEKNALQDIYEIFDRLNIDIHAIKMNINNEKNIDIKIEISNDKSVLNENLIKEISNKSYLKEVSFC